MNNATEVIMAQREETKETKETMATNIADIGGSLGYGFKDIHEIDEIDETKENNHINETSETSDFNLGTLDKNAIDPDSVTLLSLMQDIARQKSTNRLGDDNRTLSKLSGIKEGKILKTLKALQREGAIKLVYQKATVCGGWLTGRAIILKSL